MNLLIFSLPTALIASIVPCTHVFTLQMKLAAFNLFDKNFKQIINKSEFSSFNGFALDIVILNIIIEYKLPFKN